MAIDLSYLRPEAVQLAHHALGSRFPATFGDRAARAFPARPFAEMNGGTGFRNMLGSDELVQTIDDIAHVAALTGYAGELDDILEVPARADDIGDFGPQVRIRGGDASPLRQVAEGSEILARAR